MKYFIEIFREPRDIHRVVIAGVISLLMSHFIYLYESTAQNISIVHTNDYLLITLFSSICAFSAFWCVFSSEKNLILYARIFIIIGWTFLGHRLFYGEESAGSLFYNLMFVVFASSWMPFAIAGMTPGEVFEYFDDKKNNIDQKNIVKGKFNVN